MRIYRFLAALVAVAVVVPVSPAAATQPATLRILVVGDSISAPCATTPQGGWCAPLGQHLADAGTTASWSYHVHSGWSCGQLGQDLGEQVTTATPDLVILQCGTNDGTTAGVVRDRVTAMIDTIRARRPGTAIAVGFIGYSDPEINRKAGRSWLVGDLGEGGREGDANDGIYQALASRGLMSTPPAADLALYDLQRIPGNRTYLLDGNDGIHPNQMGHAVMAAIMYRALRSRYGWADSIPEPCGLYGHRTIYNPPTYTPCRAAT